MTRVADGDAFGDGTVILPVPGSPSSRVDDTVDADVVDVFDVGSNGGNSILHILISVQFPAVAKQYLLLLLLLVLVLLLLGFRLPVLLLPVVVVGNNDKDINAVGKPL